VAPDQEGVAAAITYFTNQSRQGRMDYSKLVKSHVPIGTAG
jgi:hypothetical protein